MLTLAIPERRPLHARPVFIADRPRFAPLTSLRFVGGDRIVCGDFQGRTLTLFRMRDDGYDVLDQIPSVIDGGEAVCTDLMDFDGIDRIVTSNFASGTQSIYRLIDDRLVFESEIRGKRPGQCHGVRFLGSDLLLATYNAKTAPEIHVIDRLTGRSLRWWTLDAQPQDIALLKDWVLVPARTDHISLSGIPRETIAATIYLFKRPQDWTTDPLDIADIWQGEGHLDATALYRDEIFIANQYCDRVDVFAVESGRIVHRRSLDGFYFPHGMDIRSDGLLAVTNYGDNSIRCRSVAA